MRKMTSFRIAVTYAGCFLGAGYVSGQELLQFFGNYGLHGLWGLLAALIMQVLFGMLLLLLAQKTKICRMDRLIVPWEIPWLRSVMGVGAGLFLFTVCVSMTAAFGAMLEQLLHIPTIVGGAVMIVTVTLVALLGLEGMVGAFSLSVPALVLAAVAVTAAVLARGGMPAWTAGEAAYRFPGGWLLSAATFVSFNVFGAIPILAPTGQFIPGKKTVLAGVTAACLALWFIAAGLLTCMQAVPEAREAELPMLAVATSLAPWCGAVYAVLLFAGMFGTSLSSLVALVTYIGQRIRPLEKRRIPVTAALAAAVLLASRIGFSRVVGTVYPAFGYFGFAAMVCVILHAGKTRKKSAESVDNMG